MDQRSDDIRQDIESTRASLDEKLDTLESKARQAFDFKYQISERPWTMLGAAVAAGYALGSLGGGEPEQRWQGQPATTTDYNQHAGTSSSQSYSQYGGTSSSSQSSLGAKASDFLGQFDEEIDMLKVAGINLLTNYLRDAVKQYVPALSQQLEKQLGKSGDSQPQYGRTVSTAPGASSMSAYEQGTSSINSEAIPTTTSYGSNLADRGAEHATPIYPPGSTGATGTSQERSIGGNKTPY